METLQTISIVLESIIVIVALMIALKKKQLYGYGFALTFAIYVYYDYAKLAGSAVSATTLSILFFIATLSAALSVICLYRKI